MNQTPPANEQETFAPPSAQPSEERPIAPAAQIEPEHLLVTWKAPVRPYKKRTREYYTTIAVIVFLLSIILFFAGQFLLIAVIISFAFVSYTLAAVPPETVEHALTSYGIRTGGKLYHWGELGRFWFTRRLDQDIVHIEHAGSFSMSLLLMLGEAKQDEIKAILTQYLLHETPAQTFVERASQWLQEKFPLDTNA